MLFEEIRERWAAWAKRPFPDIRTDAVDKVDLMSLDYSAAGCIDTFVHNKGKLNWSRIKYLRRAHLELNAVVRHLDGAPREYFDELRALTKAVLADVDH